MRRLFLTLWLLSALFCVAAPVRANGVTAADAKAVRAVIQSQLDAFAADDAPRAFALAAPAIRLLFGNPDNFIAMVRTGYPVVYRPATVNFLQPEAVDGDVLQRVQMTDAAGRSWMAIYRVQRQVDRSWRIGGCEVVEAQGRFTWELSPPLTVI